MDGNTSDHSTSISESAGGSWSHCWENEITSVSGLHLGSSSELNGLVEDKEVAAKAVAFVVNSTRKGIVPLCADVATLFRTRESLEQKVAILKQENASLRASSTSSLRTSHSTSPNPPSLISYNASLHDQGGTTQEPGRSCSSCSQCSSVASNSPKLEKGYHHHHHPPSTAINSDCSPQRRKHYNRHSSTNSTDNLHNVTTALVHSPPTRQKEGNNNNVKMATKYCNRMEDLPKMISHPQTGLPKIFPVTKTVSVDIQCQIITPNDERLEEQFKKALDLNSKLAEELGAARKEIEILKGRIREYEMNDLARECAQESERYHIENECHTPVELRNGHGDGEMPVQQESTTLPRMSEKRKVKHNGPKPPIAKKPLPPVLLPSPLKSCKCTACESQQGGKNGIAKSQLPYEVGQHVVIKGDKTGHIRYIGHLDNIGQPSMVFIGLELDAPVGRHDGFFNEKRYFTCHKDYGIFLPLQDVVCLIEKNPVRPPSAVELKRKPSDSENSPKVQVSNGKISSKKEKKEKKRSISETNNVKEKRESPLSVV